jgi:hypothetical protein
MRRAASTDTGESLVPLVFGIGSILIGVMSLLVLVLQPRGELTFKVPGDIRIRLEGSMGPGIKQLGMRLEVVDPEIRRALDNRPPLETHKDVLAEALITLHWIALLTGLSLVLVGVGQVAYRAWGRIVSIGWSLCAFLALAWMLGIVLTRVEPALEGICQNVVLVAEARFINETCDVPGHLIAAVLGLVLAPYPAGIFLLFRQQRVVAAMYR